MSELRAPTILELRRSRPENVVILPTALPRQVQQPHNRAVRAARATLREKQGDRFPFKYPGTRLAEKRAEVLVKVEQTPAMILAHVILAELPEEVRLKIIGRLAGWAGCSDAARQAFEVANSTALNFGDEWELMRALDAAREEG